MQRSTQAETTEPKLPLLGKDLWLNSILPLLDEKALLRLSTASKETRYFARAELLKRPEFTTKIRGKLDELNRTREAKIAKLSKRASESRQAAWLGGTLGTMISRAASIISLFEAGYLLANYYDDAPDMEKRFHSKYFFFGFIGMCAVVAAGNHFTFEDENNYYIEIHKWHCQEMVNQCRKLEEKDTCLKRVLTAPEPLASSSFSLFASPYRKPDTNEPEEKSSCMIL